MTDHVSQIHPQNGSGENDCFEASLLRYLRDMGILDPAGDVWAQLDRVCVAVRGAPDSPNNPYTTLAQCEEGLASYRLKSTWTDSLAAAAKSPYAICLVDAHLLRPAQYPDGWLGPDTGGDHFILWLPLTQGDGYWFNDPLAYSNGQVDNHYDPASVAAAFCGAYLLPGKPAQQGTPPPLPLQPSRPLGKPGRIVQRCGLKSQPNHLCNALTTIPAGAPITVLSQTAGDWTRIVAGHYLGWVLRANTAA